MKNKWLLLTLVLSLFAGAALLTGRHFHTHDDLQVFRLREYLECYSDGQLPCRWSSGMGKGYGYPYFLFYPPLIYALPALIHTLTGQSLIFSLNLAAYLTFPLAAYAMYRLALTLTKRSWLGFVAAGLYTFAPYHALNLFVRGVYAENLAWALFPLLLAWVYDLCTKNKSYAKLTLGLSALLLTHNISVMLMLPVLLVWGLILSGLNIPKLVRLATSLLWAFGISAWFFLPAIFEKSLVQTESMIFGYYSYLNHFVSLRQIFLSNYWGFGGSGYETQFDGMSFAIGYPLTIGALIGLALLLRAQAVSRIPRILGTLSLSLGGFFLFMTHAKSTFIWQSLPVLAYIQFPWRFLGLASSLLIIGLVISLAGLKENKAKVIGFALLTALIFFYADKFRPEKYDTYTDQDFISGQFSQDQKSAHLFDYLPQTAISVPDEFRSSPVFRSPAPLTAVEVSHNSRASVLALTSAQAQTVTLAQYDYPGWEVSLDGQPLAHSADPRYGFITVSLPAGAHQLALAWHETPLRKLSDYLTIISGLLFLLYNIYYANRK